jgi:hypothetical protein
LKEYIDWLLKVDVDEIIKKNIEDRAIVCIDEFDKLAKDV